MHIGSGAPRVACAIVCHLTYDIRPRILQVTRGRNARSTKLKQYKERTEKPCQVTRRSER